MAATLSFRSYRSSSAGNCLALWTDDGCLFFDCGIKTLRDCRTLLQTHQDEHGPVTALVVSHAHGDHVSRQALRVFGDEGIPIRCHRKVLAQLRSRRAADGIAQSAIHAFGDEGTDVGDFRVSPLALSHAPDVPTFGFAVTAGHGSGRRKIVIATDFCEPSDVLPHLAGTDFLFLEANHDPQLLSEHFNPSSRWHLSNGQTAHLLVQAFRPGARLPRNVVLGHLSDVRNRDRLAVREIERGFARAGLTVRFHLETAPKFEASRIIPLAERQLATQRRLPF